MKRKHEVYDLFTEFRVLVENLFNCKIKMFQSDGGQELSNSSMLMFFETHGIYFRKSCPDTQQQNGVAECKHWHVLEMELFLIDPFEVLFHRTPDYSFLKPFGCACFPNFMASSANILQA